MDYLIGGDRTLLDILSMVHREHLVFDGDNLSVVQFDLTGPSPRFIKCLDTNK
jgi:hypothetical protein